MENNNIEVLLFSKFTVTDLRRKELAKWFTTTLQSAIVKQQRQTKKIFLKNLKDTPAIYMS